MLGAGRVETGNPPRVPMSRLFLLPAWVKRIHIKRVIRWIFIIASLFLLSPGVRADDITRVVQEALRTRKFYYGDVDGRQGPETTEAIRRFQEKKGFDPTGTADETTLRALGLLPHASLNASGSERVEQCRDFIDRYLHACQAGDLAAELAFYADRVDYMDEGAERKAVLQVELASYRQNWPERRFKLVHCVASPNPSNRDETIATFRYQFDVRGDGGERKGVEDLNVTIRLIGGELRIVSMRNI